MRWDYFKSRSTVNRPVICKTQSFKIYHSEKKVDGHIAIVKGRVESVWRIWVNPQTRMISWLVSKTSFEVRPCKLISHLLWIPLPLRVSFNHRNWKQKNTLNLILNYLPKCYLKIKVNWIICWFSKHLKPLYIKPGVKIARQSFPVKSACGLMPLFVTTLLKFTKNH